jgi:Helicase C-terminal domain
VPFWAWQDKQQQVTAILHAFRDEDEFGFHWPLVKDILPRCRVIFTGAEVQIAPTCLPMGVLPSFSRANRRIFMTATLPDDGLLVEDFGAAPELVAMPVTPRTAGDLGDRMIVAPQETHPEASEMELRELVAGFAKTVNVVVIVPSTRRAEVWKPHASLVLSKETLREGVTRLTKEHVGLAVLLNRYDGVDLPGDACRVLVIDGVPEAYTPVERLEAAVRSEGEAMTRRQIQRIEQGMGRGVRANDDYCVVVLLGSRLAQHIHAPGGKDVFSPGTRAQMELSFRLTEQLQGQPLSLLERAFRQCLERNEGWVTASRNAVVGVSYSETGNVGDLTIRRRRAFDPASRGEHRDAARQLQDMVGDIDDVRLRGWVKQEAASYLHPADKVQAQELQRSAVENNPALSRPIQGITYRRLSEPSMTQARLCSTYLSATHSDANSQLLGVEAMLASLDFGPDTASDFEAAMKDLGLHLGFGAQRPEHESGAGPDVLWAMGEFRYLVIECKSEAVEDVPKRDAAQLGNAIDWFKDKYDKTCRPTPLLVHPTGKLRHLVVVTAGTAVLDSERLPRLRDAMRAFATAVAIDQRYRALTPSHRIWRRISSWAKDLRTPTACHRKPGDRESPRAQLRAAARAA